MPKLRCFHVTGGKRSRVFTQPFVGEEEERSIFTVVDCWATFAEVRQVKWTTNTAAKLAEESFDSFRAPATEIVWILVKGVELWTVVFQKRAAVKTVGAVL